MHDIRQIRENPENFLAGLRRRGSFSIDPILELDRKVRGGLQEVEDLQSRVKQLSREIGEFKKKKEEPPQNLVEEALWSKDRLATIEGNPNQNPTKLREQLNSILARLPNIPADEVPDGEDETQNLEVSKWGTPGSFAFTPKEHADLGPALGLDFETGALLSGARFTFLKGQMARLHRALAQFMLDTQTATNGYMECNVPLLVKDHSVFGTGQLPKFADDLFFAADMSNREGLLWESMPENFEQLMAETKEGGFKAKLQSLLNAADTAEQFWLIPTAEVSLTNAVREQILDTAALPLRMTALTPCFRSEAGSAGRDTRGFIRQHQFEKVELVAVCKPEESEAEHERMVAAAEGILQALELPYRKVLLCSGDMGFTARKTFDLEVWLPGQNAYREISSISNCGDFQARRMNARYKPEGSKKTEFVHTLNGSGLAVGRTLVAVLENYQQEDGSVLVPEALKPWMGGIARLEPLA